MESISSGVTLSDSGIVMGEWSEVSSNHLLRRLRKVRHSDSDWLSDVFILAKLAHTVLSEYPHYRSVPVFTSAKHSTSLFIAMAETASSSDEWDAFANVTDNDVFSAVNIARWILGLSQQTSSSVVFVEGPFARSSRMEVAS
jgi:hypothetical protein